MCFMSRQQLEFLLFGYKNNWKFTTEMNSFFFLYFLFFCTVPTKSVQSLNKWHTNKCIFFFLWKTSLLLAVEFFVLRAHQKSSDRDLMECPIAQICWIIFPSILIMNIYFNGLYLGNEYWKLLQFPIYYLKDWYEL